MTLYVWEWVPKCGSGNFFPGGGVLVIAADFARAQEIAYENGVRFDSETYNCQSWLLTEKAEERFIRFPESPA